MSKKLDILVELDSLAKNYDNPVKCAARDAAIEIRALREHNQLLCETGKAVVDRWNSPLWKEQEHTGNFIHKLWRAVANVNQNSKNNL